MFSEVDCRSKLETVFVTLASIVVVGFGFIVWFAAVGLTLLYALGAKLPGTSTLSTAVIFFLVGAVCMLYVVSLAFVAWYLYRRRSSKRFGECIASWRGS